MILHFHYARLNVLNQFYKGILMEKLKYGIILVYIILSILWNSRNMIVQYQILLWIKKKIKFIHVVLL